MLNDNCCKSKNNEREVLTGKDYHNNKPGFAEQNNNCSESTRVQQRNYDDQLPHKNKQPFELSPFDASFSSLKNNKCSSVNTILHFQIAKNSTSYGKSPSKTIASTNHLFFHFPR
jgi:hypothetical protein